MNLSKLFFNSLSALLIVAYQCPARKRCKRGNILDKDDELRKFIIKKLTNHFWTPEQIAEYLSKRQSVLRSISHETIYS